MARPRKPWYRKANDAWYVEVDGKQVLLAKGKKSRAEATDAFHRLMAAEGKIEAVAGRGPTCREVLATFLDWVEANRKPGTYGFYRDFLKDWDERHGKEAAAAITPLMVTRWVDGRGWSDSYRRQKITALKAAFNWAVKHGLLTANPIAAVERPRMGTRRPLTHAEVEAIRDVVPAGDPFRDLFEAAHGTGCRPGELWGVTAADVDFPGQVIRVGNKTEWATGRRVRLIRFTADLTPLLRRLCEARPSGPIFLNSDGQPWTRNAVRCRFRALRKKLGLAPGATAYGLRHRFGTDGATRGVPLKLLAEFMGHSNTRMVDEVYASHVRDEDDALRDVLKKVRPGGPDGRNDPSAPGSDPGTGPEESIE